MLYEECVRNSLVDSTSSFFGIFDQWAGKKDFIKDAGEYYRLWRRACINRAKHLGVFTGKEWQHAHGELF